MWRWRPGRWPPGGRTSGGRLPAVRDLVAGKFRVQYTIAGIWYLLQRGGWICQIGARRAIERDDGAVEWKKESWPRIKAPRRPRRLDRLRRRVRPVCEAAAVADLGTARDHPGHPGPRRRQRAHLGGRAGLLPARRPGGRSTGCACTAAARARPRHSPGPSTGICSSPPTASCPAAQPRLEPSEQGREHAHPNRVAGRHADPIAGPRWPATTDRARGCPDRSRGRGPGRVAGPGGRSAAGSRRDGSGRAGGVCASPRLPAGRQSR